MRKHRLFNGEIECGTRALILLEALYPAILGLEEFAFYDYFVVHAEDIGGPISIHPALPSRVGEYRVRGPWILDGLALMQRAGMVDLVAGSTGPGYRASDDASTFVDLLAAPYNVRLVECARWLADRTENETCFDEVLRTGIAHLESMSAEGGEAPVSETGAAGIESTLARFALLEMVYRSDLDRLAAMEEDAFLLEIIGHTGKRDAVVDGEGYRLSVSSESSSIQGRLRGLKATMEGLEDDLRSMVDPIL